jgi:soluble lytic murein transglycosylase-like protein
LSPLSPKEPSFSSSTPRLIRDFRFLPPLALNGNRIRSGQKSALLENSPQRESGLPEQAATMRTYGGTITATARQLGVDPTLSLAIAQAESGIGKTKDGEVILDPRAISSEGAVGLFQLMEATGKEQLREIAPGQRYNPSNPSQNIQLGVSYLKEMRDAFLDDTKLHKDLSTTAGANEQEARRLAVAAYNAGLGRVARAQELARSQGRNPSYYRNIERYLPRETRQYVKKVESFAAEFRGEDVTLANRATTISTENVT